MMWAVLPFCVVYFVQAKTQRARARAHTHTHTKQDLRTDSQEHYFNQKR
jgi:hypothetical protein